MCIRDRAYSMAVQVMFRYFMGRMALYYMDEEQASDALEFAAKHCNKKAIGNKMLIMRYLIPLKLRKGIYPLEELLEKYKLIEYIEISKAIRTGNVLKFNQELEYYEQQYVARGLYLVIDKLRYMTYRNLFKKALMMVNPPNKQMLIESFRRALELSCGEEVDALETESLLAHMIDNKHLLGYIIHEKGLVVMTKSKEIFPSFTNTRS
eukprot:TRINITY_DN8808_c0_g1_i1.p1 TRINITY_DN8808_c0_g1~~TRINITY_DN8808_c0_g1_i1.p1  ORF type:complete len:208 (-),score=47.67 TRINITY_DN8808_c0_g1_i1:91-714(-)